MPFPPPPVSPRIRKVHSFQALISTPFADGVNALCWERELTGDYSEVVRLLGPGEGILPLDEEQLQSLPLSPAGRQAADQMLQDLRLLRDHGLAPELNCIHAYPRDAEPEGLATDVYSFHADSATTEADTYLCTYHGPASEGLPNEHAQRHVDIPHTRAALLKLHDGPDDETFREFLSENCFDLHYAPLPQAQPYAFGLGHLWRIAVNHPTSPVPPCIHRAPETHPGQAARLLLIS
ncbi:hypothetical protein EI77_04619 [Prosthecobacter fusiformis]|uniref:DUF1826 domain-containing protein n=1 Tax=Prosthecobacter fusiformis TaxID=48464 RepID=A0A4R7RJU9_9BACT|nr:hypothetical protein [Prosthecobacter fusiformis]TDU62576.1 hypothetical protein EI77_04619 [Prosthecobacter fusiformis]